MHFLHSAGQGSVFPMVQTSPLAPVPPGSGRGSHSAFGQSTFSYVHFPSSHTPILQALQRILQPLSLSRGDGQFAGFFTLSRASLILPTSVLTIPFCELAPGSCNLPPTGSLSPRGLLRTVLFTFSGFLFMSWADTGDCDEIKLAADNRTALMTANNVL